MAQRRQCQSARVRCLPFSMEGKVRPPYEARCHDNGWKPRYRPYSWAEQPHQNIRAGSEEPSASPTQPFSWKRRRSPETAAQGFEVRAAVLRQWPPRAVGPQVHARYLRYLAQCLTRGGPPGQRHGQLPRRRTRRADGRMDRRPGLRRMCWLGRWPVAVCRGSSSSSSSSSSHEARGAETSLHRWMDGLIYRDLAGRRCRGRGAGAADDDGLLRVFRDADVGSIISRTLQTQTRSRLLGAAGHLLYYAVRYLRGLESRIHGPPKFRFRSC